MSNQKVVGIGGGCEKVFIGRNRWIPLDRLDEDEFFCRHTVCPLCYEKHLKPRKVGAALPGMMDVCLC